jgi:tripartite-type tricarboxylate transporter receptor subunit TctC
MANGICGRIVCAAALISLSLHLPQAWAEWQATRIIRLIVPYPPGNIADIQARLVGERLSAKLRQPVVIDNRPGATGQIGIEVAARSTADGHTLVVGQTGTFAVAPQTRKLPYNVIEDFVPIAQFSSNSLVLFVHASIAASSLPELIRLSRIKPGALRFGSNGEGGLPHLSMELLKMKTGIDWLHVPYKGTSQLEADLVAGHIDVGFGSYGGLMPQVEAGKLKMLASTGAERIIEAPDLPTFIESGVPDFEVAGWFGAFAPAKTPREAVIALNAAINSVLQEPELQEKIRHTGATPEIRSPEGFGAVFLSSYRLWRDVVKSIGLPMQ